jgi:succinyl-CoA synthetase beta subunit
MRRALPASLESRLRAARGPLGHADARALLEAYGVPFARERTVATAREALSSAEEIGYPLVVKTARPDVLHRTEAGGVVVGVRSAEALSRAVEAIEARLGPGPLLVQEEVPQGLELLVGGRRDPSFGPTVVVGLGGLLAEFLRDASVGLAPLSRETARALIAEGRRPALLRGFRGGAAVDQDALAGLLVGVGDLLVDHPAVEELDLNPLIASAGRLVAVDALVLVNPRDDA